MRTPKLTAVPPVTLKETGLITQIRTYQLITPLFGGGVTAAETDPVTPIRGTEIRGHLRFWWRATRGGQFNGNLAEMKDAEDKLWGAAADTHKKTGPSPVQVVVEILNPGQPFKVLDRRNGNEMRDRNGRPIHIAHYLSPYSYAAFPLERNQTVTEGIRFKLTLTYPQKDQVEIDAALWAWETFGGIGARTRRGFGALRYENEPDIPPAKMVEKIKSNLTHYIEAEDWVDAVPHLSKSTSFKVANSHRNALESWEKLLKALKSFRQKRNASNLQNRPGRSKWPEPDEIRRLTGQSLPAHRTPVAVRPVKKFPRADFGLPIVFHFIGENNDNLADRNADPRQTTLQGQPDKGHNYDRLASPLIIRPFLCSANQAVGIALILDAPRVPPSGLMLQGAPGNPQVYSNLTVSETRDIDIPALHGKTDVLQAFLDTL